MNSAGMNAQTNNPTVNPALLSPPQINYQELADKLVDPVAKKSQIKLRIKSQRKSRIKSRIRRMRHPSRTLDRVGRGSLAKKEGRGRSGRIITKVMKDGLRVAGVKDIGSDRQPGPDDVDEDNEAPWVIDFDAGPEAPVNREVVDRWISEVIGHQDMSALVNGGKISGHQCSQAFVRKLLIHSFDTARANIKLNQDETGALRKRQEMSKDNSKKAARRRELCSNRREAAKNRLWRDLPIPDSWFEPEYHSDSESNPVPDLSRMRNTITTAAYKKMRNGADYEILTPGWRNDEVTRFRALDKKHQKVTGNRPQGTRYYHPTTRRYDMDDILDGLPRCMLNEEAWNNIMDEAKRGMVIESPPGWDELTAPPPDEGTG
ncbi:hypothetical protein FRC08_004498 [Ceratobasidium sp. 394]|nr:hypothetical protein FRC08_004498 [Ceratobasidium sp. 394]KAG9101967.1 hypothetical protein FS749_001016 [Ceratobasidium sp. UAMH 11750]